MTFFQLAAGLVLFAFSAGGIGATVGVLFGRACRGDCWAHAYAELAEKTEKGLES